MIERARYSIPEYYGTDAERLALDTTNTPDGTRFCVFGSETHVFVGMYVWVASLGAWCSIGGV